MHNQGALWVALWLVAGCADSGLPSVAVGSKTFTESYLLGEIVAQELEKSGDIQVERRFGLGDTALVFAALESGDLDFYVEYTGTIASALLKQPSLTSPEDIRRALEERGLTMSAPIGFDNTYAIVVNRASAEKHGLKTIGDLTGNHGLTAAFTHTFLDRADSYPRLQEVYGIDLPKTRGISHGLKVAALKEGRIDITDLYTTDAQLKQLDVVILEDDKNAFPTYQAVLLTRLDTAKRFPDQWRSLRDGLEGTISETEMISLNAQVDLESKSFPDVANYFLEGENATSSRGIPWTKLRVWLGEHVFLVFFPLFCSVLVGIPLAVVASKRKLLGQWVLLLTGTIQTIPSLALLCFLLPTFGIGVRPALFALFLYALLPIVRSTYSGLVGIDPELLEVADALGLSRTEKLLKIELPLAMRSITSGVKMAAVINVGTATIAAFIGAGGLGQPIVMGLGANKLDLVFLGAVPAALLALLVHGGFELLDRVLIPRGLRT